MDSLPAEKVIRYILTNPEKARLKPGQYWLWSNEIEHPLIEKPA